MATAGPVALVTGATSGIGKAAASALVDAGFEVVGTGRHTARVTAGDRVSGWPRPGRGVAVNASARSDADAANSHALTPTRTVDVNGARFAYRRLGTNDGVPVAFLTHLSATLDNWDPRVVDGIAARRRSSPSTTAASAHHKAPRQPRWPRWRKTPSRSYELSVSSRST